MKHKRDSCNMHPDDQLVLFKLSDMKYPIAGRLREFVDNGRLSEPNYVYIHRGDGAILQKYIFGFTILQKIELT